MKRTLHLTVMMLLAIIASVNRAYGQEEERVVLYESNFEEGLDGFHLNYGDASQYYDAEKKCIHITCGQRTNFALRREANCGTKFYKDVQVEWEYESLTPNYLSLNIGGNNMTPRKTTAGNPMRLDIPISDFYISIIFQTPYTNEPTRIYECYIRSIKVTGVLYYDAAAPESTINSIRDFWTLPEKTSVKVELNDASLCYNLLGYKGISDETGTFFVCDTAYVGTEIENNYKTKKLTGSITGIVSRRRGAPELTSTYRDLEVTPLENSLTSQALEIEEDDYYNHLGDLITMSITEPVEIYSLGTNITDTLYPVSRNLKAIGYVFPDEKRDIKRLVGYITSQRMYYTEDGENDISEECDGFYARIDRTLEEGKWYTLCMPFEVYGDYKAVFESYEDGVLKFKSVPEWDVIESGRPFLYKPRWGGCTYWSDVIKYPLYSSEEHGEYNFVGTFNPVQPKDGSYYLSEGNTIRPLAPGGTIKAFRAYFEPATPNAAMARAISIDGMTTAINDIEWGDGNPFMVPTDNRIYNLEGQMVGNDLEQLPKGLYIVNGKKVIK